MAPPPPPYDHYGGYPVSQLPMAAPPPPLPAAPLPAPSSYMPVQVMMLLPFIFIVNYNNWNSLV